jgi:hypothetical protein
MYTNPENATVEPTEEVTVEQPKKRRSGFAAMTPERVREIARRGGKAAHAAGTAHEFTPDEAREAGRKGGKVYQARRRAKKESQTPPAPET